jgi:GNAT superfamily N-acetyltransferase
MSRFILIDDIINDEKTTFFRDLIPEDEKIDEHARLIGAVDEEGFPEGVLIFRLEEWAALILHIEVYPFLKRRGIGTALVDTLLRYLEPVEYAIRIEAYYMKTDEDSEVEETDLFFRSLPDFEVVSGGKYCTVTTHTIWNSARLELLGGFKCSIRSFAELNKTEKKELAGYLSDNHMQSFVEENDEKLIPELSLCHVEEGKCSSLVIFRDPDIKRTLEISFIMSRPGDQDSLLGVLNEVIKRLKVLYPHHNLVFIPVNKESELLAKRFFTTDLQVGGIYSAISFGRIMEDDKRDY